MTSKPRQLALLNTAFYLLNAAETSGIGPFSRHFSTTQDNATISEKYQTIITPFGFAFSIWGVIFLMQAVFCYVCNFWGEEYSAHPLVVKGVSYYYLLACLAQTVWSPAFAHEHMYLAAVFMSCILIPLIVIAVKQYNEWQSAIERNPRLGLFFRGKYYWLLQFPFELHLAWIIAALVLNINVVLVAEEASSTVQVVSGVVSLAVLTIISLWCLVGKAPNYTIPSVAIWTTFWIYIGLHNPKSLIVDTFSEREMNGFCYGSIGLFFVLIYCCVWKLFSS